MPSTPGYPGERASAQDPASRGEHEFYEWYEVIEFIVPAGTTFVEAGRFSGVPQRIRTRNSVGTLEWRFRHEGRPAGGAMRVLGDQWEDHHVSARIVEVRDPAGVGGQTALAEGLFASRQIEVRNNRPGPSRERPMLPVDALATQVPTSE